LDVKRIVAVSLALSAAGLAARAGDSGRPTTPTEQLKALLAEYEAASKAYVKVTDNGELFKSPTFLKSEAFKKARETVQQQTEKCAAGCLELAEKHPRDPAALDALVWVIRNTQVNGRQDNNPLSRAHSRAAILLRRDHLRSERLREVFRWLVRFWDVEGQKLLEEALGKSPHRRVRAEALLVLADATLARAMYAREVQKQPERMPSWEKIFGKEIGQAMLKADPNQIQQEGERLLERLGKEYADVPDALTGTLGRRAALELEALRQPPAAGRPAPETEGADIDGKRLKLSDYRGKVVLLVFTGDMCAACELLHPQQRSLEKRLAGKPFAQVNANIDWSLERRKRINVKEKITWRAFQDSSTIEWISGPIATRWGIERVPTLFLLDHKGVVRRKYVGTPGEEVLARELERLIEGAEAGGKR
jgi:peroxiredoxin